MNHLRKNLMTLSIEVIFALVGLGLCGWYLTDVAMAYEANSCDEKVAVTDGSKPIDEVRYCQKSAVQITILVVMMFVSLVMLAWGVSC